MYGLLADVILVIHTGVVLFVVLGQVMIVAGAGFNWHWIRNIWFRIMHLVAIVIVVVQAWLGILCPLTTLEMWLRKKAGTAHYEQGFIQHWFQMLLFYDLPAWAFIVVYTVFGLIVLVTWLLYPPKPGNSE